MFEARVFHLMLRAGLFQSRVSSVRFGDTVRVEMRGLGNSRMIDCFVDDKGRIIVS